MAGSDLLEDRYLKPAEAAKYLGLSEQTIRNKASKGEIPFKKVGSALRFRRAELDQWVESATKAAA